MKYQASDADLIDKYLSGEMNASDTKAFEAQMQQDARLREEVALHRDIRAGISQFQESTLKAKLQDLESGYSQETPEKPKGKSVRLYWWGAAAAGVALIMVVFFLFWDFDSPQKLYASYYQPYPNVADPIERADPSAIEDNPFQLYETGQYAEAIPLFEERIRVRENPVLHFYLGLCYLETGETRAAVAELQKVATADHYLATPSTWYLGLSQLRLGKNEEAATLFRQLAISVNDFQEKARKILEEM